MWPTNCLTSKLSRPHAPQLKGHFLSSQGYFKLKKDISRPQLMCWVQKTQHISTQTTIHESTTKFQLHVWWIGVMEAVLPALAAYCDEAKHAISRNPSQSISITFSTGHTSCKKPCEESCKAQIHQIPPNEPSNLSIYWCLCMLLWRLTPWQSWAFPNSMRMGFSCFSLSRHPARHHSLLVPKRVGEQKKHLHLSLVRSILVFSRFSLFTSLSLSLASKGRQWKVCFMLKILLNGYSTLLLILDIQNDMIVYYIYRTQKHFRN